jgi:hypothetical protein
VIRGSKLGVRRKKTNMSASSLAKIPSKNRWSNLIYISSAIAFYSSFL